MIQTIKSKKPKIIEPQGDVILIRRYKPEEERGGIILPDSVQTPNILAVVEAVSVAEKHSHVAKAGDTVIVGPTAKGIDLGKFDLGDDLFLINEAEILAIVR